MCAAVDEHPRLKRSLNFLWQHCLCKELHRHANKQELSLRASVGMLLLAACVGVHKHEGDSSLY